MEWKIMNEAFIIIRNGKSIKQFGDKGYPISRIETIADRYVDETRVGYADIDNLIDHKNYILQKDDILMSHINSVKHLAKTAIFNSENTMIHGMNLLCLRVDEKILNSKYAFYYLNSDIFLNQIPQITRKSVNQASFNITNLKKLEIPVPSIEIQKQIVEVLDEAQRLIDNRKEQIELLDDLIESIFYDMFGDPVMNDKGWEVKKLDDLCVMKSGGTPTRKEKRYFKGNIPWITTRALDKLYIGREDAIEFITEEAIEKSATKIIPENSLMIGTRVGVGKVSINKIKMCTNQDIVSLLDLEENFNIKYIYKQLKNFNEYFLTQVRGATIKGINMRVLKDLNIPIPPISLQNEFAEMVQAIENQKELMSQSLKLMEDNYNNLMQKAFKGELF